MADLPSSEHKVSLLGYYLQGALPAGYVSVLQPVVRGVPLDAVVIGPQGLFVLHVLEWSGDISAGDRRRWLERQGNGQFISHPSPSRALRLAAHAMAAFLRDEFPNVQAVIYPYAVLVESSARLMSHGKSDPPCVTLQALATEILSLPTPQGALSSVETRRELADALQERLLTRTQRAREAFVFRSGGWLRRGRNARTVRQVIRYLDQHPEDGVYHLRNGTLEQWFAQQGALHLARLAHQAVQEHRRDPRAALESFMQQTGMVRPPRLACTPRRLWLGYAVAGQKRSTSVVLRKGRGRGYLFGYVEGSEPWIQVEPSEFANSLRANVTVDTAALGIRRAPAAGSLRVWSSASDVPLEIPLRLRVVPALPAVSRVLLRPLIGLALASLLGAALGYLCGEGAVSPPLGLACATSPPLSSRTTWALVSGAAWALVGLVRGITWSSVAPTGVCVTRWLLRVLAWATLLLAIAVVSPWLARRLYPHIAASWPAQAEQTIRLAALSLAVVTGTWGDILSTRASGRLAAPGRPLRGLTRGLAAAVVVMALLVLAHLGSPLWEQWQGARRLAAVQAWVEQCSGQLKSWGDGLWRNAYLRQHDRRAPTRLRPTPTLGPGVTAEPTSP